MNYEEVLIATKEIMANRYMLFLRNLVSIQKNEILRRVKLQIFSAIIKK